MRFSTFAVAMVASAYHVQAFSVVPPQPFTSKQAPLVSLRLSDDAEGSIPERSRIEGNQVDPTADDLEVMDQMITKLSNAKLYELPNAVRRAFRVVSSPRFFMRIAERTDMASDELDKAKLSALASNLVATLEAVVETTEEQLDERAKEVEAVLKAAAEPDSGEFLVPLLPSQVDNMRKVMEGLEPSSLDEGFLSTVDAYMNKCHEDGMDGLVGILQKVLQMYSGIQITRARELQNEELEATPASDLFDNLLLTDTDNWDSAIKKGVKDVKAVSLIAEIQRTMETVVLGLENGSTAQRVQAEYLRELVTRAESAQ